jgi:hypothetical protein
MTPQHHRFGKKEKGRLSRGESARGGRCALFAWLISHQPAVLFSQNKPTSQRYFSLRTYQPASGTFLSEQTNQPAVLFSHNTPTQPSATDQHSHRPPAIRTGCVASPPDRRDPLPRLCSSVLPPCHFARYRCGLRPARRHRGTWVIDFCSSSCK